MSTTLANAVQHVWRALRDLGDTADEQLLTDTEVAAAVTQAWARHSLARPRVVTTELTADGTDYTDLPADFDEHSAIRLVEHPAGVVPPAVRDEREYVLWRTPDGLKLMWLASTPVEGDAVWLTYTTPHTIDESGTTLSDAEASFVCDLAVSIAADWIAAKYATTHDGIVGADTATYRTKVQEWQSVSRRALDRYRQGITGDSSVPASARINWDTRLQSGYGHATHHRWNR